MKDYILTSPIVAAVIIVVLILFGVGFCLTQLLLRAECEKKQAAERAEYLLAGAAKRNPASAQQQRLSSAGRGKVMYKCINCAADFETPYVITEASGEKWSVCPSCRGVEFEEAEKCEYCGKYFLESRMDVMCEDCLDELEMRFSTILHSSFREHEIKALNVIYDGKDLQ